MGLATIGDSPKRPSSNPEFSASVSWNEEMGETGTAGIGLDSLSYIERKLKLSSLSPKSLFKMSST